jgi:hypothetical protein
MEQIQLIIYLGLSTTILFFIILMAKSEILLTLKASLFRKWGYGEVIEMRNNKTVRQYIAKISNSEAKIGDRTYPISSDHVGIDPLRKIPAIIVNEKIGKSVGFEEESKVSPDAITNLIIRAKTIGAMEFSNQKKMLLIMAIGIGLLVAIGVFQIYTMKQQGEVLTQILTHLGNTTKIISQP